MIPNHRREPEHDSIDALRYSLNALNAEPSRHDCTIIPVSATLNLTVPAETVARLNRVFNASSAAITQALARNWWPLLRAMHAYEARVERGRARAERKRTATRRAILSRRPRPAHRPDRLHRIRTTYRHRQ